MFLVYRYGSYYEALLRSQYNQLYLKNQVRACMIRILYLYSYMYAHPYQMTPPHTHTHTHTHQEIDHYRCEAEGSANQSREETLHVMADHTHQLLLGTCMNTYKCTLCASVVDLSLIVFPLPGIKAALISLSVSK